VKTKDKTNIKLFNYFDLLFKYIIYNKIKLKITFIC